MCFHQWTKSSLVYLLPPSLIVDSSSPNVSSPPPDQPPVRQRLITKVGRCLALLIRSGIEQNLFVIIILIMKREKKVNRFRALKTRKIILIHLLLLEYPHLKHGYNLRDQGKIMTTIILEMVMIFIWGLINMNILKDIQFLTLESSGTI